MNQLFFIAPSPLVKVVLPEWQERLLADPELIFDRETPFEFDIDAGTRSVHVKFNIPMAIDVHVRAEAESTYNWLTGRGGGIIAKQTDAYGVVAFDPENDIVRNYDEIKLLDDLLSEDPKVAERAKNKLADARKKEIIKKKAAYERLILQSEERIRRHLRMTHNNLIAQWQKNEEQKIGKYPPSVAEMVGFRILDPEIKANENKGAELKQRANEMMNRKVV